MSLQKLIKIVVVGLVLQKIVLPYASEQYAMHQDQIMVDNEKEIASIIASKGITVFSAPWCGVCKKLEKCLNDSHVQYRKFSEGTPQFETFYRLNNIHVVPTTVINGKVIIGYNKNDNFTAAGYKVTCL